MSIGIFGNEKSFLVQLQEVHNCGSPGLVTPCITLSVLERKDLTNAMHQSATFPLVQYKQKC